jgi:hypothetical protein
MADHKETFQGISIDVRQCVLSETGELIVQGKHEAASTFALAVSACCANS